MKFYKVHGNNNDIIISKYFTKHNKYIRHKNLSLKP